MVGNIASAALWVCSKQFWLFVLARVIGGLSEGNVQLSIAMITDLSTRATRSRNLAWVGISFALGFTFGPALGAYFASIDLITMLPVGLAQSWGVYTFSAAAGLSLVLLLVETVYIALLVPETLDMRGGKPGHVAIKKPQTPAKWESRQARLLLLLHFVYLFLFSGVEFVLPFLAFDRFRVGKASLGGLLSTAGLFSSLIQGGYVRRMAWRIGERSIVLQGLVAASLCSLALALTGTPYDFWAIYDGNDSTWPPSMWLAMLAFSFATATVVNGMTALYSMIVAPAAGENMSAGESLGYFRSAGQLGRAFGPIAASAVYWQYGSLQAFIAGAAGLAGSLALASIGLAQHSTQRNSLRVKYN
jgi:MFS family permease